MYEVKHGTERKDQNAVDAADSLEGQELPQDTAILEQRLDMLEQPDTALRPDSSRDDHASKTQQRLQQQQEDIGTVPRLRLIQDRLVQVKLALTSPIPLAAEDMPADVLASAYQAVDEVDYRVRLGALFDQLREDEREEWRHLRRLEEINCLAHTKDQQQLPQHQDLSQEREWDQATTIVGSITDRVTKISSQLKTIASTNAHEETSNPLRSRLGLDQQDQAFQEDSTNLQRVLARIKATQEAYSIYKRFGYRMTAVHATAIADVGVLQAWISNRLDYGTTLQELIINLCEAEEEERNHLRKLRQLRQSWRQANQQDRASPPENIHAKPHRTNNVTWELYNAAVVLDNAFECVHDRLIFCSNKPEPDPTYYEDSADLKHILATLDCVRDEMRDVCRNGYRPTMFFGKNVSKVKGIMRARRSTCDGEDYLEHLDDFASSLQAGVACEINFLRNKQIEMYELVLCTISK
ncbi:hypothetical protein BG011_000004 [Mortierella polycephala]|uniref:Uncharacterized protein n=1 Tax=Mortierella polycephala TaxID=41804 RepID=A0A9P6QG50_9FUNG|nr:hypothetical protein BG011_000004 [Mortierella polycephala]